MKLILYFSLVFLFLNVLVILVRKGLLYIASKSKTHLDDFIFIHLLPVLHFLLCVCAFYWLVNVLGVACLSTVHNIFVVLVILIVSFFVFKIISFVSAHVLTSQKSINKIPKYLNNIILFFIFLIDLVLILTYFKISIVPLLTTFGVASIVVGLALQNTLSNFFSGLSVVSEKKVQIGDYVVIKSWPSVEGYVEDINVTNILLKDKNNNKIIVPSSKLASSSIINSCYNDDVIYVNYEGEFTLKSGIKKTEKKIFDAAVKTQRECPGAVPNFIPRLYFTKIADDKVFYKLILGAESYRTQDNILSYFLKFLHK